MQRIVLMFGVCVCLTSVFLAAQQREGTNDLTVVTRDYDHRQLVASYEAPLADNARKGRNVWLQRCAFCHDGVGTPTYSALGPYLDAELITKRGDGAVRTKITSGSTTMPAFQWSLSPAQVDQVIAFMKTIGPDQRPTDAQKSGKAHKAGDL